MRHGHAPIGSALRPAGSDQTADEVATQALGFGRQALRGVQQPAQALVAVYYSVPTWEHGWLGERAPSSVVAHSVRWRVRPPCSVRVRPDAPSPWAPGMDPSV